MRWPRNYWPVLLGFLWFAAFIIAMVCVCRQTGHFRIETDTKVIWATEIFYQSSNRIRYTTADGKHGVVGGNFLIEEMEQ